MDWTLQSGSHASFTWLLVGITISFMGYWFTVESQVLKEWLKKTFGADRGALIWFIGNKKLGTFLFGFVVTILALVLFPKIRLASLGLRFPVSSRGWLLSIFLTVVLALVSWNKNRKIARTTGDFGRYPEIDIPNWSIYTVVLHVFLWALYLLAYEFMFRGVLLFISIEVVGFPIAVGINLALYGLAHVPKGTQEAIGALVLGYVLCILTYESNSVFFAWIIHCALAITNGLSAFHYRPDMHFTKRRGISA